MIELLNANALRIPLAAKSVNCVVTSPPYWALRDYGVPGQIGLEPSPLEYVDNIVNVFREVWRVLADNGTLWLNIGDSYSNAGKNGGHSYGKNYISAAGGYQTVRNMKKELGNLKPKDLVGIPWRVAFALQADGWYLRSDIIWHKPNPMPESVTDRPTKAHEYLFLLAKSEQYFYNQDAVREPYKTTDDHRAGAEWVKGWAAEGEHTAIAHAQPKSYNGSKFGTGKKLVTQPNTGQGPRQDHPAGRNHRTVWTVATEPTSEAHFATYPRALIEPCIKAGCPAGGIVLDPFAGSGTTGIVARALGRRFVGLDLSLTYLTTIARRRLGLIALEEWESGIQAGEDGYYDLPLFEGV